MIDACRVNEHGLIDQLTAKQLDAL